jgi:hypothetical protein
MSILSNANRFKNRFMLTGHEIIFIIINSILPILTIWLATRKKTKVDLKTAIIKKEEQLRKHEIKGEVMVSKQRLQGDILKVELESLKQQFKKQQERIRKELEE